MFLKQGPQREQTVPLPSSTCHTHIAHRLFLALSGWQTGARTQEQTISSPSECILSSLCHCEGVNIQLTTY